MALGRHLRQRADQPGRRSIDDDIEGAIQRVRGFDSAQTRIFESIHQRLRLGAACDSPRPRMRTGAEQRADDTPHSATGSQHEHALAAELAAQIGR